MKTRLHFTFGPVQGFVAQARRTRDLYAGSFLLSHLAMRAMEAAQEKGGEIILPDFDSANHQVSQNKHASAPNRFVAEFDDEDSAVKAGKHAAQTLQDEWKRIADLVWGKFLASIFTNRDLTREIWNRQIEHFWEISWVVGDEKQDDLLDRRKNWRTPPLIIEGGDHCTLMGQWQELSGFIRSRERKQQDEFWKTVRQRINDLDLEEGEHLCAIAFVKRFCCHSSVSEKIFGRKLDMQSWPSTVSIAAIPWQRKIKEHPEFHAAAKEYAALVVSEKNAKVDSSRRIRLLENYPETAGDFSRLSGNFLNRTALANKSDTPLNTKTEDEDKARRNELLKKLRELEETTNDRAGNFYALLLMDGDKMGELLRKYREKGKEKHVTESLTEFSKKAPDIVEKNGGGICVYAGGDDLLAMLPLDRALKAVIEVRESYINAFANHEIKKDATISAAIVFAHYRNAFSRVLETAHHLLDHVAKDATGRDAIAISVLKPGGESCQWSAKFEELTKGDPHCFAKLIEKAKPQYKKDDRLSSSFLYNLRERFASLIPDDKDEMTVSGEFLKGDMLCKLFVAEHLHGRIEKEPQKAETQRTDSTELMNQLLKTCWQPNPKNPESKENQRFTFDGVRLVRFLANDGKEGAE